MGRKKKEFSGSNWNIFKSLKDETLQGVIAVVFFVLCIFFLLSAFHKAGFVGNKIYGIFSILFGFGYYLLPLVSIMLAISFFRTLKQNLAVTQLFGGLLFFLSSLSIIHLLDNGAGGILGNIIAKPLISLFDIYATAIILLAVIIISILVIFDTRLKIDSLLVWKKIFRKDDDVETLHNTRIIENGKEVETEEVIVLPKSELQKTEFKTSTKKQEKAEEEFSVRSKPVSLRAYNPPPLSLLEKDNGKPGVGDIKANANIIKRTLQNFGIAVEMDEITIGPSVTRYALKPAEGVKLSKILGLQNNLELALAAHPVRIEAPIPGKSLVGIEIPNSTKTTVGLGTLLEEPEYQSSDKPLLISLGKGISGKSHFANISKMPHILIAGATGSGKSVTIHSIITSLLYRDSPEALKFIMIDPKRVELTLYNNIPHLLTPVITEAKKAILSLKWAAKEMDRRYDILEETSVRDIESYHKNILEPELKKIKDRGKGDGELPDMMPYIVVVIDELADIMQAYPRELESAIVRLAQMSRAVGIHLILSTQRPSVNIITGLIKANVPARIALQVASQVDSRTILDMAGAEKLLGAGDMLYISGEMSKPVRIQSAFISETEVKKVAKYLKENYESELSEQIDFSNENTKNALFESSIDGDEDDLYEDAREVVISAGKASTSYLQRKLGVGYARAARLMDMLEERGVVGPGSGAKPREVLIKGDTTVSETEFEESQA